MLSFPGTFDVFISAINDEELLVAGPVFVSVILTSASSFEGLRTAVEVVYFVPVLAKSSRRKRENCNEYGKQPKRIGLHREMKI